MEAFRNFLSDDVKADLYQRFSLANNDLVVRGNHKRLFDEFRKAHWHYLDFHCPQPGVTISSKNQLGKPIAFEDFCEEMIRFSQWKHLHGRWRQLYDDWRRKTAQAVRCGAIVIDDTFSYVLVVKGFFRDGYQFPAGKKDDDDEPYETCATREVLEETGFDISNLIRPSLFLERSVFSCLRRYFLIVGVSSDKALRPSTRNEIKEILWMKVDSIPDDMESARHQGQIPREYFLCMPWAKQVKLFCQHLRKGCLPFQALDFSEQEMVKSDNPAYANTTKCIPVKQKNEKRALKPRDNDAVLGDVSSKGCQKELKMFSDSQSSSRILTSKKKSSPGHNESQSSDKKSARRRSCRRRQRMVSTDSTTNSYSDASVETNHTSSSKSLAKSSYRKKTDATEPIQIVDNSNVGSSDSGYSDHSDQSNSYTDNFSLLTRKPFSNVGDFDALMSKAILALSQIQVDLTACKA